MKVKYVNNISTWTGKEVIYLTVGKVYDFDMKNDSFGIATDDNGGEVREFFPNPSHGKWEVIEE